MHRLAIAGYTIHPIETGTFGLDGGAMYGVVPRPLWERSSPPDERNRIRMAARALLLRGHGRTILVDTGNGEKMNEKLREIYKIVPAPGGLAGALQRARVTPEEVTDVLLTHLHFDHAGGATIANGGRPVPTFPRARYHVQKEHWEAALAPTERDRASFFPDDFLPLREHGVLEFIEGEGEIFPGIGLRIVHGHTAALQCPVISDGERTLFYCADLVPLLPHVQLPWIMGYDLRPLVTLEEKRRILTQAADEGWILFLEHDPDTAAVTVVRTDKGFAAGDAVPLG
jgi:glyoxylase-like metal-dependent hydrolase (beta-lactamase superfamily II)